MPRPRGAVGMAVKPGKKSKQIQRARGREAACVQGNRKPATPEFTGFKVYQKGRPHKLHYGWLCSQTGSSPATDQRHLGQTASVLYSALICKMGTRSGPTAWGCATGR